MTDDSDNATLADHAPLSGVEEELYADGSRFDFYQAVTLLERAKPTEAPDHAPQRPVARFETPASTAFPASSIASVRRPDVPDQPPRVTVNFMGLTGPSGVLPRHYTEKVIQVERRLRGAAKTTLRAWYDLFNNRFVGQMYRAWSSRRIDRGAISCAQEKIAPDAFTNSLQSLIGLGGEPLRDRLAVRNANGETLDHVRDTGLLRHAGTLARRQRSAAQIEALLSQHFRAPIRLEQFRGQWLSLEEGDRTRVGLRGQAHRLGVDAVAGSRVWDVQSRLRVRVGPLDAEGFERFLPDATPGRGRRPFLMLCQLTRLAIGAELDFDVQLVLRRDQVPSPRITTGSPATRLGWNSWLKTNALDRDGDDPIFEPIEATSLPA